jgi:vesicle coat complex subunit
MSQTSEKKLQKKAMTQIQSYITDTAPQNKPDLQKAVRHMAYAAISAYFSLHGSTNTISLMSEIAKILIQDESPEETPFGYWH